MVTASKLNSDLRDNPTHNRETHGPLWIPTQRWSKGNVFSDGAMLGSDPNSYMANLYLNSVNSYHHASELVPDDWISGGFVVKVHWTPADGTAGNVLFELTYLFVSAGENPRAAGATLAQNIAAGGSNIAEQIDTIGTTSAPTAGEWMRLVLNRNASDTYGAAANITGLELEYV